MVAQDIMIALVAQEADLPPVGWDGRGKEAAVPYPLQNYKAPLTKLCPTKTKVPVVTTGWGPNLYHRGLEGDSHNPNITREKLAQPKSMWGQASLEGKEAQASTS